MESLPSVAPSETPLKVDIVIDFYRKWRHWPRVAWGLRENSAYINRVIVVNDEPWTSETKAQLRAEDVGAPLLLRDHAHNGWGGARCTNEGLHLVETEYWVALNADVVMSPSCLDDTLKLCAPQTIIYPFTDTIPPDTPFSMLDDPYVLKSDSFYDNQDMDVWLQRLPWLPWRDFCVIEHTASSHYLTGRLDLGTHGDVDRIYGCRWALTFGLERILHDGGTAYNLGHFDPRPPESPSMGACWSQFLAMFFSRYTQFKR